MGAAGGVWDGGAGRQGWVARVNLSACAIPLSRDQHHLLLASKGPDPNLAEIDTAWDTAAAASCIIPEGDVLAGPGSDSWLPQDHCYAERLLPRLELRLSLVS